MKYQILICFAFLVIAVSCQEAEQTDTGERKQVCEPGTQFKKDCNSCRCSNDGFDMACTRKSCPGIHTVGDSQRRKREQTCQPNTTFKKDCNTCRCSEDGTKAVCTYRACLGNISKKPTEESRNKRELTCQPNTTFKKECNTCRCSEDGTKAVCTQRACLGNISKKPTTTPEESRNKRETCEPNKSFKKDCNTCTCNPDGKGARCTLLKCPSPSN